MAENRLPIANLCQLGAQLNPPELPALAADPERLRQVDGRFATTYRHDNRAFLARDKLGLNKLFLTLHPHRGLLVANYLTDLLDQQVPLERITSVPAGAVVDVDLRRHTTTIRRYHRLPHLAGGTAEPARLLATTQRRLEHHLHLIKSAHPTARAVVCLSGGLDSALIAALTRKLFPNLVAYTYTFLDHIGEPSPDAVGARHLAAHLNIPLRLVTADEQAILNALAPALRHGQDWRDFNLHAAIVNELLAHAIATDINPNRIPTLVFTGDLMNELLGDYTTIRYRGRSYYPLPPLAPDLLRISLVRGLQAGDREVGVFAAHGLTAVQPYAAIASDLLRLPSTLPKPAVIRALASGRLPPEAYRRPKARAQIGSHQPRTGILPFLTGSGRTGTWLQNAFAAAVGATDSAHLRDFIRGGTYRCPNRT